MQTVDIDVQLDIAVKQKKYKYSILYGSCILVLGAFIAVKLSVSGISQINTDTLRLCVLLVLSHIAAARDLLSKRVPNKLVLIMLCAWAAISAISHIYSFERTAALLLKSLIGGAVSGGLFLIVYAVSRRGLGGGDVKFMAAAGLYLTLDLVLTAMITGTLLAGFTSLILLLAKRVTKKTPIPLVPFLYGGILITVFASIF